MKGGHLWANISSARRRAASAGAGRVGNVHGRQAGTCVGGTDEDLYFYLSFARFSWAYIFCCGAALACVLLFVVVQRCRRQTGEHLLNFCFIFLFTFCLFVHGARPVHDDDRTLHLYASPTRQKIPVDISFLYCCCAASSAVLYLIQAGPAPFLSQHRGTCY